MANIRNTNVQTTPRISIRRSALLATMGDKQGAAARLGRLDTGLGTAYGVADASAGRYTSDTGSASSELRDRISRLRWRLLHARTTARSTDIVNARSTVQSIRFGLNPPS